MKNLVSNKELDKYNLMFNTTVSNLSTGYVYDIETFYNMFCAWFVDVQTCELFYFEISERTNDWVALKEFTLNCRTDYWIGFNNCAFDYPVIHGMVTKSIDNALDIHKYANGIIKASNQSSWATRIRQPLVKQIDLFLINHYDNASKRTSLKKLEINMCLKRVQDLPYNPKLPLPHDGFDKVKEYCKHDIVATSHFLKRNMSAIELRMVLSTEYRIDMMNFNDSKIGTVIFKNALQKSGVELYEGRSLLQTPRNSLLLSDCILPYIELKTPEFREIHNQILSRTLKLKEGDSSHDLSVKGVFKNLVAELAGVEFKFGSGGIHGSVSRQTFTDGGNYRLFELDVASYYPNLSIQNGIFPEHLQQIFCEVYLSLYLLRKSHPKGSAFNKALKFALNGTFGNSGSKYSFMYDMKFLMSITLNGQLLMAMLIENVINIPTLSLVTANTDGLVISVHEDYFDLVDNEKLLWEDMTGLELEYTNYRLYAVRDVNNYYAETTI